jgi:hypothetical protein
MNLTDIWLCPRFESVHSSDYAKASYELFDGEKRHPRNGGKSRKSEEVVVERKGRIWRAGGTIAISDDLSQ